MKGLTPIRFITISITFLFVVAMLVSSVSASGHDTPSDAVSLDDEVTQGALIPLEQHWYKITLDSDVAQLALRLVIDPNESDAIDFVTLSVFEAGEISLFDDGDVSQMTTFATGDVVLFDNDPDTGERYWGGNVEGSNTYYIQVANESDFEFDYFLFNEKVNIILEEPEVDEPEEITPEVEAEVTEEVAEDAEVVEAEVEDSEADVEADVSVDFLLGTPDNPAPLLPGLNRGSIPAGETYVYEFKKANLADLEDLVLPLQFTMFATPDNGHRRHYVNFELYDAVEYEKWVNGEIDKPNNFGAGMISDRRDDDYLTLERSWRGSVINNDDYYIAVTNGAEVEVDYWLYNDEDIYNPILGELPEPPQPVIFAAGASPQTAVALKLGLNKATLGPGEEAWYSFRITDFDENQLEQMALTMVTTPSDGNRIRNMVFDVFTAGDVNAWSPGDNTQITNLGAGQVVVRDSNPLTGERFWQGWVLDNDLYLVQIRNGNDIPMDYWLYTGDVYSPELGEPTVPIVRTFEKGTAPGNPNEFELGVNDGELESGEEVWYTFRRLDAPKGSRVDTSFTLVFTPNNGNNIRDINIELFEPAALRDWSPDDFEGIVPFGRGERVERDGSDLTGEFIWKGQVNAGDLYYMRVINRSGTDIDFDIFPEDVIAVDQLN